LEEQNKKLYYEIWIKISAENENVNLGFKREWTKFREGGNYQTNYAKQSYNNLLTTSDFNI
jgi:hypothetical protein